MLSTKKGRTSPFHQYHPGICRNAQSFSATFDLTSHLQHIIQRIADHDVQLNTIYEALENLLDENATKKEWDGRERIGFKQTKN